MDTVKVPAPAARHAVLVALQKRYGSTTKVMKDRRQPRGGARNRQPRPRGRAQQIPRPEFLRGLPDLQNPIQGQTFGHLMAVLGFNAS
jgi:hypothetical protein